MGALIVLDVHAREVLKRWYKLKLIISIIFNGQNNSDTIGKLKMMIDLRDRQTQDLYMDKSFWVMGKDL